MESTCLNENCCNGAAAAIKLCLDYDTLRTACGICLIFSDLCNEKDVLKKVGDTHTCKSGYGTAHNVAAPLLGHEGVVCELALYGVGVSRGLIHLIDGNDDLNACSLCMVDSLNCLGHDTVVCRNDEDSDISSLCTAGTHCCERLVSGGVKEGDILAVDVYGISTDMLCDTAGLTLGDARMADSIEKRCLTVVNVTHYADNGGTLNEVLIAVLLLVEELLLNGNDYLLGTNGTKLVCNKVCRIVIDDLVYRNHHAHHHKALNYLCGSYLKTACKLAYAYLLGDRDLKGLLLCLHSLLLTELFHSGAFLVTVLRASHIAVILLLELLLCGSVFVAVVNEAVKLFVVLGKVNVRSSRIDNAGCTRALTLVLRSLGSLLLSAHSRLVGSKGAIGSLSLGLLFLVLVSLLNSVAYGVLSLLLILSAVLGGSSSVLRLSVRSSFGSLICSLLTLTLLTLLLASLSVVAGLRVSLGLGLSLLGLLLALSLCSIGSFLSLCLLTGSLLLCSLFCIGTSLCSSGSLKKSCILCGSALLSLFLCALLGLCLCTLFCFSLCLRLCLCTGASLCSLSLSCLNSRL